MTHEFTSHRLPPMTRDSFLPPGIRGDLLRVRHRLLRLLRKVHWNGRRDRVRDAGKG